MEFEAVVDLKPISYSGSPVCQGHTGLCGIYITERRHVKFKYLELKKLQVVVQSAVTIIWTILKGY